ncbi:MAG: iron chaperone [Bacteroidia bacterium]
MERISKLSPPKNIDEYIISQPEKARKALDKLRQTIKAAALGAEEAISYQMPAFKYHGMLVYFAAWKNHIGFYPVSSGIITFEKELSSYESSKGTVKFPIDKPIPFGLISKIVKFRVRENLEKEKLRSIGKSKKK